MIFLLADSSQWLAAARPRGLASAWTSCRSRRSWIDNLELEAGAARLARATPRRVAAKAVCLRTTRPEPSPGRYPVRIRVAGDTTDPSPGRYPAGPPGAGSSRLQVAPHAGPRFAGGGGESRSLPPLESGRCRRLKVWRRPSALRTKSRSRPMEPARVAVRRGTVARGRKAPADGGGRRRAAGGWRRPAEEPS